MRDMTRETFAVGTDVRGRRFIYQATDELDKNHDKNDRTFETIGEASIYEVPGSPKCPVQNYLMFLSVINPKQNALGKNQKHQWEKVQKSGIKIWRLERSLFPNLCQKCPRSMAWADAIQITVVVSRAHTYWMTQMLKAVISSDWQATRAKFQSRTTRDDCLARSKKKFPTSILQPLVCQKRLLVCQNQLLPPQASRLQAKNLQITQITS